MKIKTLIKKLQQLDPDKDAKILYTQDHTEITLIATDIKYGFIVAKPNVLSSVISDNNIASLTKQFEKMSWYQKYRIYLKSDRWRAKRAKVLKRDNFICQSCLEADAQQVHHLNYNHVGMEPLFDLVSVCNTCHKYITEASRLNQMMKFNNKYIFGSLLDFLVSEIPDMNYNKLLELKDIKENKTPWTYMEVEGE